MPITDTYTIVSGGASGGTGSATNDSNAARGDFGKLIATFFALTTGDVLTIAVGGRGVALQLIVRIAQLRLIAALNRENQRRPLFRGGHL